MPVTKFPFLKISLFCKGRSFWIFDKFKGLFKETNGKNWKFCVEKERKRKKQIIKVGKILLSSNMTQKERDQKERESWSKFLISKSLNMNS